MKETPALAVSREDYTDIYDDAHLYHRIASEISALGYQKGMGDLSAHVVLAKLSKSVDSGTVQDLLVRLSEIIPD
ncbi:MAG: hypothetical protein F4Y39_21215 [Gemmatimonadetes bacterium]|nr:hypothetical protein [Gemmatimonadota bacterium]MYF79399.1 hypothetical protein [Chloroflexota bacterium]